MAAVAALALGPAPAWGWGPAQARSAVDRPQAACLAAPRGGAGAAVWLRSGGIEPDVGRDVVGADLGAPADRPRGLRAGRSACPVLSADGTMMTRRMLLGSGARLVVSDLRAHRDTALAQGGGVGEGSVASGGGQAVVAWLEGRRGAFPRFLAAARRPDGSFGAPRSLEPMRAFGGPGPIVRMDDAGNAVALWMVRVAGGRVLVRSSRRTPGGAFGAPVTLTVVRDLGGLALAVAPDGAAVAAWEDGERMVAATSAPGGSFGPAVDLGAAGVGGRPRAAAASGGAVAVGWSTGSAIVLATAAPGGTFGPGREVWRDPTPRPTSILELAADVGGFTDDPAVAVDGTGRAALAWVDAGGRLAAATVAADGAAQVSDQLGSPCRRALDAGVGIDDAGQAAVAFLEHGPEDPNPEVSRLGVVRVLREGPRAPAARAPRIRVRVHAGRQDVRVRVVCPAGCELHATLRAGGLRHERFALARAGRPRTLTLDSEWSLGTEPLAPGARVRLHVDACSAAGGVAVVERALSLRR